MDLTLAVGAATTKAQVTAVAPLLNTGSGSLGQVINAHEIENVPLKRNQFGTAVGGPMQRDKTSFFAAYEVRTQNHSLLAVKSATEYWEIFPTSLLAEITPWEL